VLVWRLCRRRHSANPLDGRGARKLGGRWNRKGTPIVYCSATLSLAALEYLVHVHGDLMPEDQVSISIELPAAISSKIITPDDLPRNWRKYPAPLALQEIGTAWAANRESLLLRVPSSLIPTEQIYLLNPAHGEISKVRVKEIASFRLDPMLAGKKA